MEFFFECIYLILEGAPDFFPVQLLRNVGHLIDLARSRGEGMLHEFFWHMYDDDLSLVCLRKKHDESLQEWLHFDAP